MNGEPSTTINLNARPLVDVLVEMYGFEKAANKLESLYLVDEWPSCQGEHTCGKNGCGGNPSDLFSQQQIAVVKGWVEKCRAAALLETNSNQGEKHYGPSGR